MVFTYFRFLLPYKQLSVFVGNLFGGGRSEYDFGTAPKFYNIEFDEVPAATNSASLQVSGIAENLDEITIYVNGSRSKKIEVDSEGKFSTVLSNYERGTNSFYAIGRNDKTTENKKA